MAAGGRAGWDRWVTGASMKCSLPSVVLVAKAVSCSWQKHGCEPAWIRLVGCLCVKEHWCNTTLVREGPCTGEWPKANVGVNDNQEKGAAPDGLTWDMSLALELNSPFSRTAEQTASLTCSGLCRASTEGSRTPQWHSPTSPSKTLLDMCWWRSPCISSNWRLDWDSMLTSTDSQFV